MVDLETAIQSALVKLQQQGGKLPSDHPLRKYLACMPVALSDSSVNLPLPPPPLQPSSIIMLHRPPSFGTYGDMYQFVSRLRWLICQHKPLSFDDSTTFETIRPIYALALQNGWWKAGGEFYSRRFGSPYGGYELLDPTQVTQYLVSPFKEYTLKVTLPTKPMIVDEKNIKNQKRPSTDIGAPTPKRIKGFTTQPPQSVFSLPPPPLPLPSPIVVDSMMCITTPKATAVVSTPKPSEEVKRARDDLLGVVSNCDDYSFTIPYEPMIMTLEAPLPPSLSPPPQSSPQQSLHPHSLLLASSVDPFMIQPMVLDE